MTASERENHLRACLRGWLRAAVRLQPDPKSPVRKLVLRRRSPCASGWELVLPDAPRHLRTLPRPGLPDRDAETLARLAGEPEAWPADATPRRCAWTGDKLEIDFAAA